MWIVYLGDPARLRADVLPLPAGRLVVLLDRRAAAPRRQPMSRASKPMRCIQPTSPVRGRRQRAKSSPLGADPDPDADPDRGGLLRACKPASSCCRRACAPSIMFALLLVADADRHAGLDRARPDRADLHVHADRRADRIGGAEAVHRASKASRSWRSRSSSWPATSSPMAASRAG